MLESKHVTVTGCLQPRSSIDEKDHIVDEMFFAKILEGLLGQCLCSRREESDV